jgi:hypothetical protein
LGGPWRVAQQPILNGKRHKPVASQCLCRGGDGLLRATPPGAAVQQQHRGLGLAGWPVDVNQEIDAVAPGVRDSFK